LIAVGARFDDRVTGKIDLFAPHAKIIHMDIDPASIAKNVVVHCPIVGDVKHILRELNRLVKKLELRDWYAQIAEWKQKHPMRYNNEGTSIKTQYVIQELSRLTNSDAVVTTGVGQHQMWAAQWYTFKRPRTMITSGGLGTMGFGFPAAIGAQLGRPKDTVICIDGDGSFQMTMFELATAVSYKIPVKVAIIDNLYLGMVRQWQELFYRKRYSGSELGSSNPDFVKIAEGFGAFGVKATKKDEVTPAIEKALAYSGPAVMHFLVEAQDNVYPMVPAGQALDQVIDMA
jgi:acetolactate synthase-1/2/3 large subunit